MKVTATEFGIYGKVQRFPGQVFEYQGKPEDMPKWMEPAGSAQVETADHEDAEKVETAEQRKARIELALNQLKHDDDDHWTPGGKPKIAAVRMFFDGDIEPSEVSAAFPDFIRQ